MKYYCILMFALIVSLQSCWSSSESSDREECTPAFEANFGFEPPPAVKEIKLKNFGFRDGTAHWMSFTYDPEAVNRILKQDTSLLQAVTRTPEYGEIIRDFLKENPNQPSWFSAPGVNTTTIYYKKDFLPHTFSEYYLWVDSKSELVFLHVHYFD